MSGSRIPRMCPWQPDAAVYKDKTRNQNVMQKSLPIFSELLFNVSFAEFEGINLASAIRGLELTVNH